MSDAEKGLLIILWVVGATCAFMGMLSGAAMDNIWLVIVSGGLFVLLIFLILLLSPVVGEDKREER